MAADSPGSMEDPAGSPEPPGKRPNTTSPHKDVKNHRLHESSGDLTSVMILQESALRAGNRMPIEQLNARLTNASAVMANTLALVCNEITYNMRQGEQPKLSEYQRRYPELADVLAKIWFAPLLTDASTQSLATRLVEELTEKHADASIPADVPAPDAPVSESTQLRDDRSPAQPFSELTRLGEPTEDQQDLLNSKPPSELLNHDRYRLIQQIGQGGMGSVWLAMHIVMNRPVALKVIRSDLLNNRHALARFQREVQAAARLQHPNIVTAFDAEQIGETHFLVVEFVEGQTLSRRVANGKLNVHEACRAIRDAANGMAHAHAAGLVHRDIKPGNLIRSANGTVKVLDFGLVIDRSDDSSITGNSPMGTTDYIAPEQVESPKDADARSDIYSLGCTLYHLLVGRAPFAGLSPLGKLVAHRDNEPPRIQGIPNALQMVVSKMMSKLPEDRYQTAEEVVKAVAPFCDPATPSALAAIKPSINPWPRRLFIGAALGCSIGIFAFLPIKRKPPKFDPNQPPVELPLPQESTSSSDGVAEENRRLLDEPNLVVDAGPEHYTVDGRLIVLRATEVPQVWFNFTEIGFTNISVKAKIHVISAREKAVVKFVFMGFTQNSLNFDLSNYRVYLREDKSLEIYPNADMQFTKDLRKAWTEVEMTIRGKLLTVIIDGKKMMEVACEPAGRNNLSLAAQKAHAEIFDLRVIKLD